MSSMKIVCKLGKSLQIQPGLGGNQSKFNWDLEEITLDPSDSKLDAIIAYYHHKVKDSRMQAIIRIWEETDKYIHIQTAT